MGLVGVFLYILAWVCAFISMGTGHQILTYALAHYLFLFLVGIYSLCFFFAYCFYSEKIADHLEWPSNPFQFEMGFAHLALAVLGILCFFHQGFWASSVIVYSIAYFGLALVRFIDCQKRGSLTISRLGMLFAIYIVSPLTLIIALSIV